MLQPQEREGMDESQDVAPRILVEQLRQRVERHGRDLRELAAYIDSLHPERMDERMKVMRRQLDEIRALKPELFGPALDAMRGEVRRMTSAFNRMLVAIVLSCVSIVLAILGGAGKL